MLARQKTNEKRIEIPITKVSVQAYIIPTSGPEADGTFAWNKTTLVLVHTSAGGKTGIGYTYADTATASLIHDYLAPLLKGHDAMSPNAAWQVMVYAIRNLGRPGICSMAIAALDSSLWDLKARLLNLPLATLLGQVWEGIPVYGSGGFTSYSLDELTSQLQHWAEAGIKFVKMKIGSHPEEDLKRVQMASEAIGDHTALFVDANGAYTRKQALEFAEKFSAFEVKWFEEPVSSDDLEGLRLLRDRASAGMDIAAGEYGYDLTYFRRMLDAGAVDVLQADATRCAGITDFLRVGALCQAHHLPLSAHTAPTIHLSPCCALPSVCHIEYFYDHVRIEEMAFDGVIKPVNGILYPDLSRPGMGIEVKEKDLEKYEM